MNQDVRGAKNKKDPNFAVVVALSALALLVIFACAYFLIGGKGRKLLPRLHRDPQPTSYLLPAPSAAPAVLAELSCSL